MKTGRHWLRACAAAGVGVSQLCELEHAEDRRVRQFVHGEAGERMNELLQAINE